MCHTQATQSINPGSELFLSVFFWFVLLSAWNIVSALSLLRCWPLAVVVGRSLGAECCWTRSTGRTYLHKQFQSHKYFITSSSKGKQQRTKQKSTIKCQHSSEMRSQRQWQRCCCCWPTRNLLPDSCQPATRTFASTGCVEFVVAPSLTKSPSFCCCWLFSFFLSSFRVWFSLYFFFL